MTRWKKSSASANRKCSLKEYGVSYRQVDLLPDGTFDYDAIRNAIDEKTKLVTIQRSKGYATRPSFSVAADRRADRVLQTVQARRDLHGGQLLRRIRRDAASPPNVGADMVVGSLIKNPGGGLAPIGGYICGTAELRRALRLPALRARPRARRSARISVCCPRCIRASSSRRPSSPARSRARSLPPISTSSWASACIPNASGEPATTSFRPSSLAAPERMLAFCRGIQAAAPVDSYVDAGALGHAGL